MKSPTSVLKISARYSSGRRLFQATSISHLVRPLGLDSYYPANICHSALQRLTEIAAENSGAQRSAVIMKNDEGEYGIATNLEPPEPCRVYE
jgi:hypothetical protein